MAAQPLDENHLELLRSTEQQLSDAVIAIAKIGLMPWNHGAKVVEAQASMLTNLTSALGDIKIARAQSNALLD